MRKWVPSPGHHHPGEVPRGERKGQGTAQKEGDGTRNGSREWDSWGFPGILTLSGPAEYGQPSQDRQSLNSMPDQEHRRDEK